MTEPAPEPTLADVLAAIGSLAVKVDGVDAKTDALASKVDTQGTAIEGLRLDFAAHTELAQARHVETTQALEGIAGLVHAQQGLVEGAVSRSEARITSRLEDLQRVVQTLKADLAAHASDTQLHRDAHGTAA